VSLVMPRPWPLRTCQGEHGGEGKGALGHADQRERREMIDILARCEDRPMAVAPVGQQPGIPRVGWW
jgi:hypothetical protein